MQEGKQERYIIPLVDIQQKIQRKLEQLKRVSEDAEHMIAQLDDPRHRAVLTAYYLSTKTWEDVARDLSYDVRWVYKLREEALEQLQKNAPA